MAISPILTPLSTATPRPAAGAGTDAPAGPGFGSTLDKMVQAVNASGDAANDAVSRMLDGSGDVHEAMIALQKSDMTFQFAVQVRNKIVQAYQDIMRMPV